MEVLKKVGKFFLSIITFILMIALMVDIVIYNIRNMSIHYFEEDTIKEIFSTIDITKLWLDSNGNELKQITEIKNELVSSGMPVEVVEEFLNSKPMKEMTANIVQTGIDVVIYNKQAEIPKVDSEEIYSFFEKNMPVIADELKTNNAPNSELLTDEKQEIILQQIKENTPIIEEKVNELVDKTIEEFKNMSAHQELEGYKKTSSQVLNMIQFIYSKTVTEILIVIGFICAILIMVSRRSFYKGFKWIAISFMLAGSEIYSMTFLIPFIKNQMIEVPYIFSAFVTYFFDDITRLCLYNGMVCYIVAVIFVIINIVGYIIHEKRENKKFDI